MIILALDLGKFNTMCCFFDTETRTHTFLNAATNRGYLETVFKTHSFDLLVMEACGPSGWVGDLAESMEIKTIVCSTNEEAWKWSNVKRKTDKDDARKLARMAASDELQPVHMPTATHREFRSLVKYRKTLDGRINKSKNTIRAWFVNQGVEIDRGDKAWHTGRERINSFRKPLHECAHDERWRGELDIELTILDSLSDQLNTVVKKLEAIGKQDARIRRLMTIPGVGPRTAEILVACIDDPHRFKNGRQVAAYFGLVPKQYQSGETDRNGRITKRGNPLARTILVECAWCSVRYNSWAKEVYERICGKQKTRKKKAGIALARKLAVIAWAMLRDERDWAPTRMIEVTESYGEMSSKLKETLQAMKPKENSDQRKSRLRKEARAAKAAATAEKQLKQDESPASEVSSTKSSQSPKQPRSKPKRSKSTKPETKASVRSDSRSQVKSSSQSRPKRKTLASRKA